MRLLLIYCVSILLIFLSHCKTSEDPEPVDNILIQLTRAKVGATSIDSGEKVAVDQPVVISFNSVLDTSLVSEKITLSDTEGNTLFFDHSFLDDFKTISLKTIDNFRFNTEYVLEIKEWKGLTEGTFPGIQLSFTTERGELKLLVATVDGFDLLSAQNRLQNISRNPTISLLFSEEIDPEKIESDVLLLTRTGKQTVNYQLSKDKRTLDISPASQLEGYGKFTLFINSGLAREDFKFDVFTRPFYTEIDSTLKFPEISDEDLLTKVQERTFKYFWDFGHPVSGLARERNTSNETVTIGGSGFGVMAILVGIERGFITRQEGIERLETIINFLDTKAERFHGVWSHWLNGTTGKVVPFSANDDGADLVETAFMVQALLTVRQYLDPNDAQEASMITTITTLWEEVEWDWFVQDGDTHLTWHWSPNFGFEKDLAIRGWNEALIIYVLAASSPTHPISKEIYTEGWARNGAIQNGNSFYGYQQPLGNDRGDPLFFAHYSFLGLDPRNLNDAYANYWTQNVNHTLINRAYCIENPLNYVGYTEQSWGLTASDGNEGYSAHSPGNDRGVITPTAAISSIPYTPNESMEVIRHFYYILGDRLWGEYGFYDAFNVTEGWYADSYIAIDQGPIVCMIENHRTALLWELFMMDQDVKNGLDKLGFTY